MALSERRKADRQAMAETVVNKARSYGFGAELEHTDPRRIDVRISTRHGLALNFDFDGTSPQPDVYVLPWCIWGTDAKLHPRFGIPGCEVNPHHFRKCTAVAYGFYGLLEHLDRQFSMIRDGGAFQTDSIAPTTIAAAATTASP